MVIEIRNQPGKCSPPATLASRQPDKPNKPIVTGFIMITLIEIHLKHTHIHIYSINMVEDKGKNVSDSTNQSTYK